MNTHLGIGMCIVLFQALCRGYPAEFASYFHYCPPSQAIGPGAGTSSPLPPAIASADRQTAGENGCATGLSSMNSSRQKTSGPLNSGSHAKQKNPAGNDPAVTKDTMVFLFYDYAHPGGSSSRQAAAAGSREAFAGSEADPQRSRATDASHGDPKRSSSGGTAIRK
ncbi:hypothetical protein V6N13_136282 [Hibiscus sabdariffa]